MKREEMIEKFQCPGCVHGPDPATCPAFEMREMDLGGFKCDGHARGTAMMTGLGASFLVSLGLPPPFHTADMDKRNSNLLVLIDEKGGQEWLTPGTKVDEVDGVKRTIKDSQNIPVWKMRYEGCTLVRIARPATCRFTTLVIDGDVDVPEPAIDVGDDDRIA
jgi:hypothetical protein